jgi:peroxiredoxin
VLFTFRGGWCPFCNLALDIVQENLAAFRRKGAHVVGITPQKSALLGGVAAEKGLEYTVLSDEGYQVLDAYGVGYEVSPEFAELFKEAGKDVAAENVEGGALKLPLPSFFVIGQDGKVVYANVAYACAERPALEEVLAAIPAE